MSKAITDFIDAEAVANADQCKSEITAFFRDMLANNAEAFAAVVLLMRTDFRQAVRHDVALHAIHSLAMYGLQVVMMDLYEEANHGDE